VTQVHISLNDHTVTVQHDGADLSYVVEKAQKLFNETKPTGRTSAGPAFGFQAERSSGHRGFAWEMGKGEQPGVSA
jgi:hypothetical protein